MIIELVSELPSMRVNVTTAYGREFADLIRELEKKRNFKKIEGQFSMYRGKKGRIEIDLDVKKEEG